MQMVRRELVWNAHLLRLMGHLVSKPGEYERIDVLFFFFSLFSFCGSVVEAGSSTLNSKTAQVELSSQYRTHMPSEPPKLLVDFRHASSR